MNTVSVSATAARNNFFQLLEKVKNGTSVVIKKDNKEIAIIMQKTTKTDWKSLIKWSKKTKGVLPKNESLVFDKIKAEEFLGKWDTQS